MTYQEISCIFWKYDNLRSFFFLRQSISTTGRNVIGIRHLCLTLTVNVKLHKRAWDVRIMDSAALVPGKKEIWKALNRACIWIGCITDNPSSSLEIDGSLRTPLTALASGAMSLPILSHVTFVTSSICRAHERKALSNHCFQGWSKGSNSKFTSSPTDFTKESTAGSPKALKTRMWTSVF